MDEHGAARAPRHDHGFVTLVRRHAPVPLTALTVLAVTTVIALHGVPSADAGLVRWLAGAPALFEPPLVVVMQLGTLALAPAVAVAVWAGTRRPGAALAVVVAAIAARFLSIAVKHAVGRGRPPELVDGFEPRATATDFGFVSGHTAVAFAVAAAVAGLVPARGRRLVWVTATLVGIARVYLGVHFPLDVVGGAALGIVVGMLASSGAEALEGPGRPGQGRGPSATRRATTR